MSWDIHPRDDTPILLEKVIAKLDWKSYFRLQQTSKDMKKIIRSCQKIAIRMGGCCLPCKETGHLLCYSEQLQLIDTEDLWGTRLQRLSLEREHTNLIGQCCESLKKSRITFEELSMSYLPLTKESYVKVLEIVKPEKIGMTDATTEGEFMVGPDPDGALFMLTALLPEFQVYTGSLHRVNYDIEQVYDYLCIILQFLRDHALPRLRKFYFMITLRDVQPELSANELLDKFRDFKPVVNKMNGISTIELLGAGVLVPPLQMLDFLPYHLLRSIYQLLDPKDLSSMMAVQYREMHFINKYRELFRKKAVLLRLKAAVDHVLLEIYAAEFRKCSPSRIKVFPEDIKKLPYLPGMSIRTVVVEGSQEADSSLLAATLEKLEVFPECSVIFKNVNFSGHVEPVLKVLNSLKEIPLFRLKTCTFPSTEFASRLLKESNLMSKVFLFEDDYSSIRGEPQPAGRLGDELLDDFLKRKCEKMSFSLTENVSWTAVSRFIEDWKRSPREFTAVSFIRTAAFNDDVRAAGEDFTRNLYTSPRLPGIGLRLHLDNRVHAWISTEAV